LIVRARVESGIENIILGKRGMITRYLAIGKRQEPQEGGSTGERPADLREHVEITASGQDEAAILVFHIHVCVYLCEQFRGSL
jgi:hypothetical protein